ncbi:MAG: pantetheine-phosphate adenylyltransferase [Defluviitaleaceae bacterium]|nr:pantetheine-phosphate adenylyltransferase [Defluviitaleaceae bacterium]
MNAVYPGSFDPVTLGHMDIIHRAAAISDVLTVAVLNNPAKNAMFTVDERVEMLRHACQTMPNVQVTSFRGMLAEFVKQMNGQVVIKGVRNHRDFEYENQMAQFNKMLNNNMETLFLPASTAFSLISSSAVKEIALMGGDVSKMVSNNVYNKILQNISRVWYNDISQTSTQPSQKTR